MPFNENLTNPQAKRVWKRVMKNDNNFMGAIPVTKDELREFIDAADQWISDNLNGVYSSMPVDLRSQLTAEQKAKIFLEVAKTKIGVE